MASIIFAATLQEDGSLTMPKGAADELGLHPGDEVQVRIEMAQLHADHATASLLDQAVYAMTHRTPDQISEAQARAMEAYKPIRTVPAGRTLADVVSGKWPGDESDAQINAALSELS